MLARVGARAARQALKSKTVVQQPVAAFFATSAKSSAAAPVDEKQVQTLIHEVAEQQKELAAKVSWSWV